MTPEEKAVVEAVGRFFGGNGLFVLGDWVALENANRAYHKSLEPKPRYVVVRSTETLGLGTPRPVWVIHDTHGPSLPNNYEPTCRRPEDAERIAKLLNEAEKEA